MCSKNFNRFCLGIIIMLFILPSCFGEFGYDPMPPDMPKDPETLDALISKIKAYEEKGKSLSDIATYLSQVIDRRLLATNQGLELCAYQVSHGIAAKEEKERRWTKERETSGGRMPMRPNDPKLGRDVFGNDNGMDYIYRAQWAWNLEAGNCDESASISYYVLKNAGIPVRFFSNAGHAFAVIGVKDDYDPDNDDDDPADWGPNAVVVDGWTGSSWTAGFAQYHYLYHSGKQNDDMTDTRDNRERYKKYLAMANKGNLQVMVKRADTGAVVKGAEVVLEAAVGTHRSTQQEGFIMFDSIPASQYGITVIPEVNSGLKSSAGHVTVDERRILDITIELQLVTIGVVSPENGSTVSEPDQVVAGTVDEDAVTSVNLNFNGNSQALSVSGGKFQTNVELQPGENTLYASIAEIKSNTVKVKFEGDAIIAKGNYVTDEVTGPLTITILPEAGNFSFKFTGYSVMEYGGKTYKSSWVGAGAGRYTGDREKGKLVGMFEFRYDSGTVSTGNMEGSFAGGVVKGRFFVEETEDETGEIGTFTTTVVK